MGVIQQTNRSILFEEINPEKNDLLTMLSDSNSSFSLNDDIIDEINRNLLVRSFDEFLERFSPTIYAFFDTIHNKMRYSLVRPNIPNQDLVQTIVIDRTNDFLNMFLNLFDARKSTLDKNQLFHFEHMLDYLSPHKKMEEIKASQVKLLECYHKYVVIPEENPEKKQKQYEKLQAIMEDNISNYYDIMSLVPIAIEDLKKKLIPAIKHHKVWNPITSGVQNMKEEDIHILSLPELGDISADDLEKNYLKPLKELILDHYRSKSKQTNEYIERLLLRSFGLEPNDTEHINKITMVDQYNRYLDFYLEANEEYIEVVKPLMEKILGIKVYFDQYEVKDNDKKLELLITNVRNDLWMSGSRSERLNAYFNTVNSKNDYRNTIWFSILPNITFPPDRVKELSRERFKGNKLRNRLRTLGIEVAGYIMEITSRFGIQSFFSYECDETTTFIYTANNGVGHFTDGCKPFMKREWSEYVIPCFPNFTIVPREKSFITIGKKLRVTSMDKVIQSEDKGDVCKLWMGGFHIEAAYVAAGLVGAYQCSEYLAERHGKDVAENLPGVRYDIEADNNRLYTVTTMEKEITGYKKNVLEETDLRPFGFFFSSETNYLGKEKVEGITVRSARNLSSVNNIFEPIYKITTSNYIERIFRYDTFDYRKGEIIRFFQNNPKNRRSIWQSNRKKVNAILREEDGLNYELDERNDLCILEVEFGGQRRETIIDLSLYPTEEGEK